MEVCRGKEAEALKTYQKVLMLDADNLAANIFIGNYLYLKAEREKQRIENEYKKIAAPTRMQYARYRDGLSRVMSNGYGKAREYLLKVVSRFPSTEARKTLDKIQLIEKEVNRKLSVHLFFYYLIVRIGSLRTSPIAARVFACSFLGPGISGLYVNTRRMRLHWSCVNWSE